jgi:hypothetical protein
MPYVRANTMPRMSAMIVMVWGICWFEGVA